MTIRRTVTLSEMITAAREAADMVGADFVTDAEVTSLINTYAAELYDLLVAAYGESYYQLSISFPTVVGTDKYDLTTFLGAQTGLYKLLGVDLTVAGEEVVALKPFNFHDRNLYKTNSLAHYNWPTRYRWMGSYLWLIPTPAAVYTMTVHYIPFLEVLVGSAATFDGINGWERYVIVSAAIAMLQKEQSDPSILLAEKASLTKRIEGMAHDRDAGEPAQVVDVSGRRWRGRYLY